MVFTCFIFSQLLSLCIIRKIHNGQIFVVVLLALVFFPHLATKFSVNGPYSSFAIPIATFYYILGYKMKDIVKKSNAKYFMIICLIGSNIVIVRLFGVSSELASGHVSPIFFAEIAALCGLFSVIAFSKAISKFGGVSFMLIWLGRNSLSLMLVHQLLKAVYDEYLPCFIILDEHSFKLVQFVWTVASSVIITKIINYYCPIVLGKK